ncbi:MAG: DnaA regulatory inactivator Hda [Acidiferrobacterales bacterium]
MMTRQLHLDIRLKDSLSFANYFVGPNREPVERLSTTVQRLRTKEYPSERALFLWGARASGKTHLLQAACHAAQQGGDVSCAYVPLSLMQEISPAILEGLEQLDLVCIDDLERICRHARWEQALFSLVEGLRNAAGVLVAAARANPAGLDLAMPDLATRLGWGLVYQIYPLGDTEKIGALRLRARNRGLEMSEQVARYVLHRHPRDAHSVFDFLEQIDEASLVSQRRITIPFIRGLQ